MTTKSTLIEFLEAIIRVKELKDKDGVPYACFASFSEECDGNDLVCQVCQAMTLTASDDWIEAWLKRLKRE